MALDTDSMVKIQVIEKDGDENPVTASLEMKLTLGELIDFIHAELDNYEEPTWEE